MWKHYGTLVRYSCNVSVALHSILSSQPFPLQPEDKEISAEDKVQDDSDLMPQ